MLAFAAPGFLWGLALLPVVVALHFLRRARRERTVSALWLWPGGEAPSRRARFSPTLLLLLQLLAVAAASVGAAGPRVAGLGRDLAIVVDAGAGMAATDASPSRLGAAVREARGLLGGARRAVVVRAGLAATVAAAPTADRGELGRALDALGAGDSSADLAGAVRLARTLLPGAELHLFTPGEAPPGFAGVLHTVRGPGRNVGITAFSVRGGRVFAALEGNGLGQQPATVVLRRDGRELARATLTVPGGGRAVWSREVGPTPGEYRLSLTGEDALPLDDEAVAVIESGRVLVSPPQDDVLRAVASVPGVRASIQDTPPGTSAGFDAVVLVGAVPRALPAGRYLIFAPLAGRDAPPARPVSSWDAASSLLRFADLAGVRARVSAAPPPEIPGGGWRTLARVGESPFVLRGEGEGVRAVYVAAHPLDSDLRSSPAFPVLVYNLLTDFLGAPEVPLGTRLPEGEVSLDNRSAPGLTRALLPGLYRVDGRLLVANLGSSAQTRLPAGAPSTRRIGEAAARLETAPPASPWQAPLLALALAALGLEAYLRGPARLARRAA